MRRSGLGRGLGALIPAELGGGDAVLQELPIGLIEPNPNQPRVHFDEEALVELAASIREMGVLQPVLVRPIGPETGPETSADTGAGAGRFQLIAGERRWRAARRAGLDTVPAIVRPTDDASSVEQALVENLHRQDLSPLEEAAAYQQLLEDFSLTHEEVAQRVGKSRAAVSNTLRLLQLPPAIQHLLGDGRLSAGHARALLGTPDRGFQETLARRAVAEQLSVREVEEAVRRHVQTPPAPAGPVAVEPRSRLRPPGVLELEELLSDYLATRVRVSMGARKGKVVIEFASLDDLERIYRLVTEAPEAR